MFIIDIDCSRCQCPSGYNGPRCQQTARSFRGNGWAWYPALEMCDTSHLSFEFITRKGEGVLLYNGPIVPPESDEIMITGKNADFQDVIKYLTIFNNISIALDRFYFGRIGTRYTETVN